MPSIVIAEVWYLYQRGRTGTSSDDVRKKLLSGDYFYIDYVHHAPDAIATALRTIADPRSGAVLVHCAAGKDRTGIICALTHHIAGVHPDDIMADYLLTNDEARQRRKMDFLRGWLRDIAHQEVDDEALRVAVGVNPAYLEAAFQVIRDAHGSIDAYLEDALGVDAALRERLHARLLA